MFPRRNPNWRKQRRHGSQSTLLNQCRSQTKCILPSKYTQNPSPEKRPPHPPATKSQPQSILGGKCSSLPQNPPNPMFPSRSKKRKEKTRAHQPLRNPPHLAQSQHLLYHLPQLRRVPFLPSPPRSAPSWNAPRKCGHWLRSTQQKSCNALALKPANGSTPSSINRKTPITNQKQ